MEKDWSVLDDDEAGDWAIVDNATSFGNVNLDQLSDADVDSYRKTFDVDDRPLFKESCSLAPATQGTCYVSRKWLCFVGGFISKTVLRVALSSVLNVEQESWRMGPKTLGKSVKVTLDDGRKVVISVFSPFGGSSVRARLFVVLSFLWKQRLEVDVTLAEGHEKSEVADLMLKRSAAAPAKQVSLSDSHRLKLEEQFRLLVRQVDVELVDVKKVSLAFESSLIPGNLFIASCLAFAADSGECTLTVHLSEVTSEEVVLVCNDMKTQAVRIKGNRRSFFSDSSSCCPYFLDFQCTSPEEILQLLQGVSKSAQTLRASNTLSVSGFQSTSGSSAGAGDVVSSAASVTSNHLPVVGHKDDDSVGPGFPISVLKEEADFSASYEDWNMDRLLDWKAYLLCYAHGSLGRPVSSSEGNLSKSGDCVPLRSLEKIASTSTQQAYRDHAPLSQRCICGPVLQMTVPFRVLIRNGVPDELRREIWLTCSCAYSAMLAKPGYYARLARDFAHKRHEFGAMRDIRKDVLRTLPMHPFYQDAESAGIKRLERVLSCFALHNPMIGYTQSQNFLSAVFLLYMTEEEAFWMLCTVCEHLSANMYRKSMVGSLAQLSVLERLLVQVCPAVAARVDEHGFRVSMAATGWFMCLFVTFLPLEICLRVLDNYFYSTHFVFRVALSIFILNEQRLLESTSIEDVLFALGRRDYVAAEVLSVAHHLCDKVSDAEIERMMAEEMSRSIHQVARDGEEATVKSLQAGTRFSLSEARHLYDTFRDYLNPKAPLAGLVEKEFCASFTVLVPCWRKFPGAPALVFKSLNKALNGAVVEFREYILLLDVLLNGTAEERLSFCVKLYADNISAHVIDAIFLFAALCGVSSLTPAEIKKAALTVTAKDCSEVLRQLLAVDVIKKCIAKPTNFVSDVGEFETI